MLSHEDALNARKWYVVDAEDAVVGRLATRVAGLLRGKGNPGFTPHQDCGDFVIVLNASKVRFTGNKTDSKKYYRHSGYPGGIRETTARRQLEESPETVVTKAVVGMLPKNRLGRQLALKLKVYSGAEHPHVAQQPTAVSFSRDGGTRREKHES